MANTRSKVALVTLGCPKNVVDSEYMREVLRREGFDLVTLEEASFVILNTCAFIGSAVAEAEEEIAERLERKRRGRIRGIAVGGCLVERKGAELKELFPEVDVFFRIDEVPEIAGLLRGDVRRRRSRGRCRSLFFTESRTELETPGHYAYLKVAEGCNHRCSFCLIPKLRGRYRSREMESLVREARSLAKRGVKELILVAQDLTRYGFDLYGEPKLEALLEKLSSVPGIHWIRLLYLNPQHLSRSVLEAMAVLEKVVKYVELPVQHISDRVLQRMRRAGGAKGVHRAVSRARELLPEAFIRTEVIVGFPGETPGDFDELLSFLEDTRFERVGIFAYEDEDGTASFGMADKVPPEEVLERYDVAKTVADSIMYDAQASLLGRTLPVIVDGEGVGRTVYDAPDIDFSVRLRCAPGHGPAAGEIVHVQMEAIDGFDLVGSFTRRSRGR